MINNSEERCKHRHSRAEHPRCFEQAQDKLNIDIKIGVMDIETLPAISYNWGLYNQNIATGQIIHDTCFLSWSGKYLNDYRTYSDILTPDEAKNRDPRRITKSAFKFLSDCQIIIGHNWKQFDGKLLNNYFLLYEKPLKYFTIDTLEIARNNFRFMSNKLSFINDKLGIRNKIETEGFPLWIGCNNGDIESLRKMLEYNEGDIIATESLYYKIRSFMPNHPNLAKYNEIETEQCPVCTSEKLETIGKYSVYESVRCQNCGAVSRRRVNLLNQKKRKSLLA